MNKKNWDIIIFIVWALILIAWIVFFISTKYVSKEFIYQETKECNKLKGTVEIFEEENENSRRKIIWWVSETTKEIFYSPKWNECVAVSDMHTIKWISSEKTEKYTKEGSYKCNIYMNKEKIKEYDISYRSDEDCDDKLENLFTKRVESLKRWY